VTFTARDIELIEGPEAIRRRASMFIGEPSCARLIEATLGNLVEDTPPPRALRLLMWRDNAFTIAVEGEPFPIAPPLDPPRWRRAFVPQPTLYFLFLHLQSEPRRLSIAGPILNALTERLVVSTFIEGRRYRASLRRGGLAGLLGESTCDERYGDSWMTFRPDASVVPGGLSPEAAADIAARVSTEAVCVSVVDRLDIAADWS
jgi:hypothetical protein